MVIRIFLKFHYFQMGLVHTVHVCSHVSWETSNYLSFPKLGCFCSSKNKVIELIVKNIFENSRSWGWLLQEIFSTTSWQCPYGNSWWHESSEWICTGCTHRKSQSHPQSVLELLAAWFIEVVCHDCSVLWIWKEYLSITWDVFNSIKWSF